jgi:hypothetical protein
MRLSYTVAHQKHDKSDGCSLNLEKLAAIWAKIDKGEFFRLSLVLEQYRFDRCSETESG